MTKYHPKKSKKPLQAIRYYCFECFGWNREKKDSGKPYEDVKGCTDEMCPLFDFRMGKNPFHASAGSRAKKGLSPRR